MSLETATYINGLVSTNPTATDNKSEGDDHIRLLKSTIQATFPSITGAVTATHTELNYVDGVTSAIQTQLDSKAPLASPAFTGVAAFPAGAVGAPSITTTGDLNTGLWFPAADTVAISTSGGERLRVFSTGIVSIGNTTSTINPTNGYTFTDPVGSSEFAIGHVSGTVDGTTFINFNYNGSGIGSITQVGTTGVAFNTSSDDRLKTNVVDAPSAGNVLDALRVVSFDWKADGSHVEWGVIAQEVHNVAPFAVTVGDGSRMWGVDYSKFVPALLKEVQELRARVAALEAKE